MPRIFVAAACVHHAVGILVGFALPIKHGRQALWHAGLVVEHPPFGSLHREGEMLSEQDSTAFLQAGRGGVAGNWRRDGSRRFRGFVILRDRRSRCACDQCEREGEDAACHASPPVATRPRSELLIASVMTTSTNRPTNRAGAGKFTERMFSVLPVSSSGFFFDGPSTRTRCTLPTIACEIAAA